MGSSAKNKNVLPGQINCKGSVEVQGFTNATINLVRDFRLGAIILAVVTFFLYANTLQNGFAMDDAMVIQENTLVNKGIAAIPQLLATPRFYGYLNIADDQYRPVSLVMFAIENQFFGQSPLVGHFVNILVYIGCVLLLFRFLANLIGADGILSPFLAALVFVIHPLHTEVVANIKSRDELMCFLFAFVSLNQFWGYAKSGKSIKLILGFFTLFLAYLSKEDVIAFVVIIPILFFFYSNADRRRSFLITSATIAATTLFLGIRWYVLQKYASPLGNITMDFIVNALINPPSSVIKVATEIYVLGKYLLMLFIPYPLLCNYSYNSIPFVGFGDFRVIAALLIYLGLVIASAFDLVKKDKNPVYFGVIFYLVSITLFSNLFFLIGSQMAERFEFFPSVGFCIVIAVLLSNYAKQMGKGLIDGLTNKKVITIVLPLLLVFGGITFARNKDWKSNLDLFKADVEKSPEDSRLNYYYAKILRQSQDNDASTMGNNQIEALNYLNKAHSIYPNFAEAQTEIGIIYLNLKKYDSAAVHFSKSLQLQPINTIAAYNLAWVQYAMKQYNEAIPMFKKVIAMDPSYQMAYLNLAKCCLEAHQTDTAIVWFNKLLVLDPASFMAHQGLAQAFMQKQNYEEAAAHFQKIMQLKSAGPEDIYNLGIAYLSGKNYQPAIDQFKRLLAINPNFAVVYPNIGIAQYNLMQYQEAIASFKASLRYNPNDTVCLSYLAKAYKQSGRGDSAKIYEVLMKH